MERETLGQGRSKVMMGRRVERRLVKVHFGVKFVRLLINEGMRLDRHYGTCEPLKLLEGGHW